MKTKRKLGKNNPRISKWSVLRTTISSHPFFRGLRTAHLNALTGCALQTKFPGDVIIFHQGDAANRFYLIETGCVALEADQPGQIAIRIQTLGAGDVMGWSWLFPPHIWHFSARTVEPTRAIFFNGNQLRTQFEQNPGLGDVLVKHMAQVVVERLQATQSQLLELSQVAMRAQVQALQLAMPMPARQQSLKQSEIK
jgi:CRP/FNR family cyclic AMP-dependent transcriptional regulator